MTCPLFLPTAHKCPHTVILQKDQCKISTRLHQKNVQSNTETVFRLLQILNAPKKPIHL